jgi:hypothetical protein
VIDKGMSMEHQGIVLMAKSEYSKKKLSLCHFVHHKSLIDWPGIEPGFLQCETGDGLSHGMASEECVKLTDIITGMDRVEIVLHLNDTLLSKKKTFV